MALDIAKYFKIQTMLIIEFQINGYVTPDIICEIRIFLLSIKSNNCDDRSCLNRIKIQYQIIYNLPSQIK